MYSTVLTAHSWLRWAVLLLGIVALVRAAAAWSARRPWTRRDDLAGLLFVAALDLQMLLGLLLYFAYSPYTALAMDDFGAAMRTPELRFWAVEHTFGAVVGIVLAHVGRVRVRKTSDAVRRHRLTAIFFALALIAIVAAIPWPGTPNARPLIPR
jgi:hypothetical protein